MMLLYPVYDYHCSCPYRKLISYEWHMRYYDLRGQIIVIVISIVTNTIIIIMMKMMTIIIIIIIVIFIIIIISLSLLSLLSLLALPLLSSLSSSLQYYLQYYHYYHCCFFITVYMYIARYVTKGAFSAYRGTGLSSGMPMSHQARKSKLHAWSDG